MLLDDHSESLMKQRIAFVGLRTPGLHVRPYGLLHHRSPHNLGDARPRRLALWARLHLGLPKGHQAHQLLIGYKAALDARQFGGIRSHIEGIAATEKLFGTGNVQDDARVDLGGHSKADARRKVRLDEARHDIHRGPLRGDDQMNSCGASHLRQAADPAFYLLRSHHHQIGEFVDKDDDIRQLGLTACQGRLVVALDIARTNPGQLLVAALHLARQPA